MDDYRYHPSKGHSHRAAYERLPAPIISQVSAGGHHLIRPRMEVPPRFPLVVFVPGRWCNSQLWAVDDPLSDIRTALASRNFPSITVRYRCSSTENGSIDRIGIGAVRTSHLLEDVRTAIEAGRQSVGRRIVVLCGYSLGASLTFLSAAMEAEVGGIIALDGGLPESPVEYTPGSSDDCVANPFTHPRYVRAAFSRLTAAGTSAAVRDAIRWRMSQDRLWPSGQLNEIRSGIVDGRRIPELLRAVECPILCVAADDRDPPGKLRSIQTAFRTASTAITSVRLVGWRHEDIVTRPRKYDDGLLDQCENFLAKLAGL